MPEQAGEREQQRGAEAELERGGAERAAGGARELDVGAGLQAQQRADEQQAAG